MRPGKITGDFAAGYADWGRRSYSNGCPFDIFAYNTNGHGVECMMIG
jgi:hypothetical protein